MGLASPAGRPAGRDDRPIIISGYALAIANALESCGINSQPIFCSAGIPLGVTNDPLDRLSGRQAGALMKASVAATGNPHFGMAVADSLQASHFHALGYALLASKTLREFCIRLARHLTIVSQSADLLIEQGRDLFVLRLKHRVYTRKEHEDFFWAFVLRFMRMLYRPSLTPLHIGFCRDFPAQGSGPHTSYFGVGPSFGQAEMSMTFSSADMDQPLSGACPELALMHDKIAAEYEARIDKSDIRARVCATIMALLGSGLCNRSRVAQELCLSEATLQHKLHQCDVTFQGLLDDIRRDMSLGYLAQRRFSVTEITYLVGFGDTSNFTRAFKRWTGVSPSAYRQNMFGQVH